MVAVGIFCVWYVESFLNKFYVPFSAFCLEAILQIYRFCEKSFTVNVYIFTGFTSFAEVYLQSVRDVL